VSSDLLQKVVELIGAQNTALAMAEKRDSEWFLRMAHIGKNVEDTNHHLTDTDDKDTLAAHVRNLEGLCRDILARSDTLTLDDIPQIKTSLAQIIAEQSALRELFQKLYQPPTTNVSIVNEAPKPSESSKPEENKDV